MRELAIIVRSLPTRIAGWTLAAILALAAVTAYGLALWRALDWAHASTPQDRHNARVLVVSVGGAGLLYTARNYRLSRRGQITDRFASALERLASSELYVRIGGVHALERVLSDSALSPQRCDRGARRFHPRPRPPTTPRPQAGVGACS